MIGTIDQIGVSINNRIVPETSFDKPKSSKDYGSKNYMIVLENEGLDKDCINKIKSVFRDRIKEGLNIITD